MKKYFIAAVFLGCLSLTSAARAQLSNNPWVHPNDGYFQNVANNNTSNTANNGTSASITSTSGEILPVDPWAKARDTSGVQTWRGSGQHGKLNYIGEATSWGDANGQELLMPEVNRHNMIVFTDHLRKMGYKIPDSYDQNIKNMPQNYKKKLQRSFSELDSASDPLSESFKMLMNSFEDGTGLDINNIVFNTMNILGTD